MTSRKVIENQFNEIYAQWDAANKVLSERKAVIAQRFKAYQRVACSSNVPTGDELASHDAALNECEALFQQLLSLSKAAPLAPAD